MESQSQFVFNIKGTYRDFSFILLSSYFSGPKRIHHDESAGLSTAVTRYDICQDLSTTIDFTNARKKAVMDYECPRYPISRLLPGNGLLFCFLFRLLRLPLPGQIALLGAHNITFGFPTLRSTFHLE